jgi:hypothetical protein
MGGACDDNMGAAKPLGGDMMTIWAGPVMTIWAGPVMTKW